MFIKASENTAIVWKENRISYNDLLKHISYYSTLFSADKIAIYSSNRPEWVYAFYAGWKNKSIPVPIDYLSKPEEVAYILNDCKPEVIFISIEQKGNIEEILPQLNYKIKVIVFDDIEYEFNNYPAEEIDTDDLERTSVIIYTSGTTGSPKGVMLSFENLMVNIVGVSEKIRIFTPERPVLVLLPLHHIFPLLGTMIMPLYAGALIAFSPSMVSEDIINTLQKNKIRIIIGVPRLYDLIRKGIVDKINKSFAAKMLFKLAHKINSKAFSKKIFHQVHEKFGGEVEYMVCGGAKLNEETARDYKALGFEMLEGYGMTECAPMISFTRPGRWKIGSAGEILPGLEVKIVDGEITAKGKNIMQGYYERPEETAEVLKDGWIYTGDLGFVDNDGFIHITGRSKEIIVLSNGKNINPEEIENKLKESTDLISEVAVYSKNDILNVVIHPDFKKLHEMGIVHIEEKFRWDVIDAYNKNTSPSKKISKFYLSKEELPKTRLGKIKRYQLADLIETQAKEKKKIKEPEFQEYIVIRDFLKEQKQSEISPDDHLEID
ncbi:MAG: AMP-binding protein, partial [Syntrophothermus sp.]